MISVSDVVVEFGGLLGDTFDKVDTIVTTVETVFVTAESALSTVVTVLEAGEPFTTAIDSIGPDLNTLFETVGGVETFQKILDGALSRLLPITQAVDRFTNKFLLQHVQNMRRFIGTVGTYLNYLVDFDETVIKVADWIKEFIKQLANSIGGGKREAELVPWQELEHCSEDLCLRLEPRSHERFHKYIMPIFHMHFWYETRPPINDRTRKGRFVLPGLFEDWTPRGVDALGPSRFILSLASTSREPRAPLFVIMNENGDILKMLELHSGGLPLHAAVGDVAVVPGINDDIVWTCDDSNNATFPHGRRNLLFGFSVSDINDAIDAYVCCVCGCVSMCVY